MGLLRPEAGLAMTLSLFSFIFFFFQLSFSQDDSSSECPSSSDDAKKLYEKSRDKKKYEYAERTKFLEQAVEEDPDYAPANYELGMHWQRRADESGAGCEKCEKYFQSVIKNCPKYHSNPYFFMGYLYWYQEKYDSCIKYMKLFLDFKEEDVKKYDKLRYERFIVDAKKCIKLSAFYKEALGNPMPYDPKILEGVSTTRDEYLPFISPDNEICFYTRKMPIENRDAAWSSDVQKEFFCFSMRGDDGKFEVGEPMPRPPFNTHQNEGGATITIDNKHIFYTVVEAGNYDIYTSDFADGKWKKPRNLGKAVNHPDWWDSQPSISSDGKSLFFASNHPGGYGGVDIWKTELGADGFWKDAVNLGSTINTEGDEKSPFLHSDSKTLYFCSGENEEGYGGHISMGGFDIFYARQDSSGKWMKPKNIGYPINTFGHDLGFVVNSEGKYAFFATNDQQKTKGVSVGGWDIYYFELPKEARPDEIAIIKGKITNEEGKGVTGVNIELKDAVTKKITQAVVDSATGEYAVAANVEKKHDQLLIVKKEGYAFSSQLLSTKDSATKKFLVASNPFSPPSGGRGAVDMKTDSVKKGKSFTLNNIYFGPSRADLKDESKFVLDEFAEYLILNPSITINIYGHTDNVGNPQDNQNLSVDRAFTVFEYLRAKNVKKEQISGHKGFGETQPVTTNDTEEGKAKNRRTEFVIVSK